MNAVLTLKIAEQLNLESEFYFLIGDYLRAYNINKSCIRRLYKYSASVPKNITDKYRDVLSKTKQKNNDCFIKYFKEYGIFFEAEKQLIPKRNYKVDYYCSTYQFAVEIEGGIFIGGAHGSRTGILRDIMKYNLLTEMGIFVYRMRNDTETETEFNTILRILNTFQKKNGRRL